MRVAVVHDWLSGPGGAEKVTRETLGKEADAIEKKPEPPKRSTLAERAARGAAAAPATQP